MEYNGFRLRAVPTQVEPGQWSVEVIIEHPAQDDAEDFEFKGSELFATAQEAEDASISLGKQIVDGRHPVFKL